MQINQLSDHKYKTYISIAWNVLGGYVLQIISMASTVALARLLDPSDFGLIGMLSVIMTLSDALQDFGFASALIQKKEADIKDFTTAHTFMVVVGVVVYVLLFFSSTLIADFYGEKELVWIVKAYSFITIVTGMYSVSVIRHQKSLMFKEVNIIQIKSAVLSTAIAVALGFLGVGVWCLIAKALTGRLISMYLYNKHYDWDLRLKIYKEQFFELSSFGSILFITRVIDTIASRLDTVVVGKYGNAVAVGYYTRAQVIKDIPINATTGAIGRLILPVLSAASSEQKMESIVRRMYVVISITTIVTTVGIIPLSNIIIEVLYGDRWADAAIYLQLMLYFAFAYPLCIVLVNVIIVKKLSKYLLHTEWIKKVISILLMIAGGYNWGPQGVVLGYGAGLVISLIINIIAVRFAGINHIWFFLKSTLLPYTVSIGSMKAADYIAQLCGWGDLTTVLIYVLNYALFSMVPLSIAYMDYMKDIKGDIGEIINRYRLE